MIGILVLVSVVSIVVIVIVSASCYLLKRVPKIASPKGNHANSSFSVSERLILEENGCKNIPMREIYAATNNLHLHNFIGQGIAGKVYKGVLSNGWQVAIKHIFKDGHAETFLREVQTFHI
ncbi:hypothetical protein HPP92_018518 [Vanilla planifolia]|uniref:Uncharacterized protein n=1 Tax=Vanilla planifolia TaxID=51239 RepID=A0A835Q9Z0_VANPL|nr:hypothetical protein HPP92_018518 [Vanilla planifolia]